MRAALPEDAPAWLHEAVESDLLPLAGVCAGALLCFLGVCCCLRACAAASGSRSVRCCLSAPLVRRKERKGSQRLRSESFTTSRRACRSARVHSKREKLAEETFAL